MHATTLPAGSAWGTLSFCLPSNRTLKAEEKSGESEKPFAVERIKLRIAAVSSKPHYIPGGKIPQAFQDKLFRAGCHNDFQCITVDTLSGTRKITSDFLHYCLANAAKQPTLFS